MKINRINKKIKKLSKKDENINDKIGKLKIKRYNIQTEIDIRNMMNEKDRKQDV